MKNKIIIDQNMQEEWYAALVDDCKAIITEAVFTSRWALVEGYHSLGERICMEKNLDRKNVYGKKILIGLSESLGLSQRKLWYAVQFYEKYPSLDGLPEGKNISWNKVVHKYLPAPKNEKMEIMPVEGIYDVIIIDPPWPYGTEYDAEGRRAASPYEEQTLEEIQNMPIPAAEDCVLWLWTTHKFMRYSFAILDAWGFRDVAIVTWEKDRMGLGQWLRSKSEFCIMAIKGKPIINLTKAFRIFTTWMFFYFSWTKKKKKFTEIL